LDTTGLNPPLAPAQTATRENLTSPLLNPAQILTRENIPSHSFPLSQSQSNTDMNCSVGPSTNNSSSSNISTLFGGNIYGGTFTINLYNCSENKKPRLDRNLSDGGVLIAVKTPILQRVHLNSKQNVKSFGAN